MLPVSPDKTSLHNRADHSPHRKPKLNKKRNPKLSNKQKNGHSVTGIQPAGVYQIPVCKNISIRHELLHIFDEL